MVLAIREMRRPVTMLLLALPLLCETAMSTDAGASLNARRKEHGEGTKMKTVMKTMMLVAIIALAGCSTTTRIRAGECVVFKDSWFSADRTVVGHGCDVKQVYQ
jgi:hypothetical protein